MLTPSLIAENSAHIKKQIETIALRHQRDPTSIQLIAASKTHPISAIENAISAGITQFGENYSQEALPKIEALSSKKIIWHFIGPIQSNKTSDIAHHFDWVQSVDREKIARRLHEQRPAEKGALNICIEVNVGNEKNKSGIRLSELTSFAQTISQFTHLKLRGLMTIPPKTVDFQEQRFYFKQMRVAFEELQRMHYHVDTLSMGMTHDFEAAIAEGATMIRIGNGIFGERR